MTKREIYAKYGIEYKGDKILTPLGWHREFLKKGNTKTGTKVLTWSMNQTTCVCHCEGCYADYGRYRTKTVRESLAFNTRMAREHLDFLFRAIRAQLETAGDGTEVRVHAVGDFFGDAYADGWHETARDFPSLWFWTYTKNERYEHLFDDLLNANIVPSLIDGEYNFGHCDHVMRLYTKLYEMGKKVHICRCGIDPHQHCEGCHKCSECENVLFLEHSTDYRAKDDPLYEPFVALVEVQVY